MKYRIVGKSDKYYVQSENEVNGTWIVIKRSDNFDEAKEFLDNYIKPLVVLYEVEV